MIQGFQIFVRFGTSTVACVVPRCVVTVKSCMAFGHVASVASHVSQCDLFGSNGGHFFYCFWGLHVLFVHVPSEGNGAKVARVAVWFCRGVRKGGVPFLRGLSNEESPVSGYVISENTSAS